MKIFISQPMGGRSDREILDERRVVMNLIRRSTGRGNQNVSFIDSWLECNEGPIWCLGESIKLMQQADLVIFVPGWSSARGCQIEHEVCERYNIPYMEI